MVTAETTTRAHDRNFRRHPFSAWVKRLANLKNSSSEANSNLDGSTKRNGGHYTLKPKKFGTVKNNPYPASGSLNAHPKSEAAGNLPSQAASMTAIDPDKLSPKSSLVSQAPAALTGKSGASAVFAEPENTHSDTARSTKADSSAANTSNTAGGAISSHGGAGSTFSSPAPSVRSLATTLTTVQSTGPANLLPVGTPGQTTTTNSTVASPHSPNLNEAMNQHSLFSHQFPSSPPATAIPSHLAPQTSGGHPATYTTATANNLLTDNASILTLASSSKRQRRQSLDTNASVRALAPSSLWGGSRESLPLSVLSGNMGDHNNPSTPGLPHGRPSVSGIANPERASVYSVSGVGPALSSERNSYYAGKQTLTADGGSIKSGFLGHGRNDSVTGSIGGTSLLLASPKELTFGGASGQGRLSTSRRNSEWVEVNEEESEVEKGESGKLAPNAS